MAQLAAPLTGFGNYWRQIQTYLVDADNMFELLEYGGEVTDALGAAPLEVTHGAQVRLQR
jgi:ABC-type transport system involved in Fe-S cluster assembly fused permease/ATPase subunit